MRVMRHMDICFCGTVLSQACLHIVQKLLDKVPSLVAPGENGVFYWPPQIQLWVIPLIRELVFGVVIRALLIMKYGLVAQDQVPVAKFRRYKYLLPVAVR